MVDVSVVIPTYNRRDFTCEAVRSVLGQRQVTAEAIVVDDGSDDGTPAAIEEAFPEATVIRRQHCGAPAARNAGLDAASGRYLKFLDSDDRLVLDSLAAHVRAADTSGCAVSYGDFEFFGDLSMQEVGGEPTRRMGVPDDFVVALLNSWWLPPGGYLVNREMLGHIRWDESFARNQDMDYALQLAFAVPHFHYHDATVVSKRAHRQGRIMDSGNLVYGIHCEKIADKALADMRGSDCLTDARRQAVADLYWHASRLVYGLDRDAYRRLVCSVHALCPHYAPLCGTYAGPRTRRVVRWLGIVRGEAFLRVVGWFRRRARWSGDA